MKIALVLLAVLIVIALICGSWFVGIRNQMAVKKEAVSAEWSQVDVVLQRRADLIPNLVETVKGYASQERQSAFGVDRGTNAGRQDRGQRAAGFGLEPFAGDRGKLSAIEVERKFHATAG